jgi:hypothetical protein
MAFIFKLIVSLQPISRGTIELIDIAARSPMAFAIIHQSIPIFGKLDGMLANGFVESSGVIAAL